MEADEVGEEFFHEVEGGKTTLSDLYAISEGKGWLIGQYKLPATLHRLQSDVASTFTAPLILPFHEKASAPVPAPPASVIAAVADVEVKPLSYVAVAAQAKFSERTASASPVVRKADGRMARDHPPSE